MTGGGRQGGAAAPVRHVFVEAGRGRCRLWGTAVVTADGVSLTLVGGERPHVGAVAIGIPRPSLARAGQKSATTSVFAVTGHKDDELARPLAEEMARRLGRTAVVAAGVHVGRARARDVVRIFRYAARALEAVVAEIQSMAGGSQGHSWHRSRPGRARKTGGSGERVNARSTT